MGYARPLVCWTETNSEIVRKMYAEGKTYREIAAAIPGANRNCIASKIRRSRYRRGPFAGTGEKKDVVV